MKTKLFKIFLITLTVFVLVFPNFPFLNLAGNQIQAEQETSPGGAALELEIESTAKLSQNKLAPVIQNGKVVMFEASHNQDPYNDCSYWIEDLEAAGYTVLVNTEPLSSQAIEMADVLIVSVLRHNYGISSPYTASEAQIIKQYVSKGGGLMVLADHNGYSWYAQEISLAFGITLNGEMILKQPIFSSANFDAGHPIMAGINSIGYNWYTTITPGTASPLIWEDDGDAVAVTFSEGSGKGAVFGDSNWPLSIFNNYYWVDNSLLALQTVDWLAGQIGWEAPSVLEWAEVKTDGECVHDSDANGNPNPADTAKLKCFPAGWVIKNVIENNGLVEKVDYRKVIDTTDGITGWMKISSLNTDASKQEEWKQKTEKLDPTKNPIVDDDGDGRFDEDPMDGIDNDNDGKIDEDPRGTVPAILEAANKYYNSTDTVPSLYSSDDNSNNLSLFKNAGFPIELLLSIIATESYTTDFNNENVTFDYGHGVLQATFKPIKNDIKNLQIILNSDPDTKVADFGPGSPGQETHSFGGLTEDAVKRFQIKYNLKEYYLDNGLRWGRVSFDTRNKLNEMLNNDRQLFAQKGIPEYFVFEDLLIKGYEASTVSETFDNRGIGSQIKVRPCQNITEETSLNSYKKCYQYDVSTEFAEYKLYEPHINYSNRTFKYYSNNLQSIYANIKDGLRVLKQSYVARCYYETTQCKNIPVGESRIVTIDADTNYTITCGSYTSPSGTTYNSKVDKINGIYEDKNTKEKRPVEISCSDFKIIDAAWRYNGRVTNFDKKYLESLGERIKVLDSDLYFGSNYKAYLSQSLSEEQTTNWSDKLLWTNDQRSQLIKIHSPGELRIYDSENRVTGIVNGEIVEDIPFSVYDEQNGFILLPFANGSHSYEVKGNEEGAYGLDIISIDNANDQIIEFNATDIPVGPNEVHQYAIDWTALAKNERGVTLKVDYDGNGTFDQTFTSGKELFDIELPQIITPTLEKEYLFNSELQIQFDAIDSVSGVASVTGTLNGQEVFSNQIVTFNKPGPNIFEVTAIDNAGNTSTSTQSFNVIYHFGGFLPPIKVDGSGIYKQGRTLPVKFQLTDANNNFVSTAIANLFLIKVSDGIPGGEEIPLSTSNADTGNQFRYAGEDNQYIFNLSTDPLTPGSWQLKVVLDDSRSYTTPLSIKE